MDMTNTTDPRSYGVEVTQADRDAAAGFISRDDGDFEELAARFARHRADTAEPGLCPRTLEAAARTAEKFSRFQGGAGDAFADAPRLAAAAIRSLSPTTSKGGSRGQ